MDRHGRWYGWLVPELLLTIGIALFLLVACSENKDDVHHLGDLKVASINGIPVSVTDFEQSYIIHLIRSGENDTPRNRYLHFDNLADTYLLAEEARGKGLDQDSAFFVFEKRVRKKAIGGRFYEKEFLKTLPPLTDAEVREAFSKYKQQVVVRHLFYRDESAVQAAYVRLKAGISMLDEAQRCFQTAIYDSSAGYLGPIRFFQVDDAFAEAAFSLEVGAYSAPVRSRFGYHIIQVEGKVLTPIITESEYQMRKKGIAGQLALRKRRLEGDRFVQRFMRGLNVQVNAEGVQALAMAVQDLEHRVVTDAVPIPVNAEAAMVDLDGLQASLAPDTPLATYQLEDKKTRIFTAGDYYFWLPELPFPEARQRTAASVGRALRNEALALEDFDQDLEDKAFIQDEIEKQVRFYLAETLRAQLREHPHTPDEATLRAAYNRFGMQNQKRWVADFWVIPFPSRAAAEQAKRVLQQNPANASSFSGFTQYKLQNLREMPTLKSYITQAPIGNVVLVGTASEKWILLQVSQREAQPISFETNRVELVQLLAPFIGEYRLLRSLRQEATVALDTLLFQQIMNLN